jgi:putative transcriptional regulator
VTITHHLDHATVVAFAAGTLAEPLSVVAASHAAWCQTCQSAIREAQAVGGEILSSLDEASVSTPCKDRTLASLDRATLHRFPKSPARRTHIPSPLASLLGGKTFDEVPWKKKGPGIALHTLPVTDAGKGKLVMMRIAPGSAMPDHGHGGEELTLVLSGSYTDKFGRFGPGDVADLDDDVEHKPIVGSDEACICLVATEAPTRFKSLAARLLGPLIGI